MLRSRRRTTMTRTWMLGLGFAPGKVTRPWALQSYHFAELPTSALPFYRSHTLSWLGSVACLCLARGGCWEGGRAQALRCRCRFLNGAVTCASGCSRNHYSLRRHEHSSSLGASRASDGRNLRLTIPWRSDIVLTKRGDIRTSRCLLFNNPK